LLKENKYTLFYKALYNFYGVIFLSVITTFSFLTYNPVTIKYIIFNIGGITIIILSILGRTVWCKNISRNKTFEMVIVSIVFYAFINFMFKGGDRQILIFSTILLGFSLITSHEINLHFLKRFFHWLYITTFVVVCYGVIQLLNADPFYWKNIYGRGIIFSTFYNPHFFAEFLYLVTPIILSIQISNVNKKTYFFSLFLFVMIIINILFTGSLCGYIGFEMSLILFYVFFRKKIISLIPSYKKSTINILTLIAFTLVCLRFISLTDKKGFWESEILYRKYTWQSAAELIKKNALIGIGVGNIKNIFPEYKASYLSKFNKGKETVIDYTENNFVDILAEYGIVGLGLFSCLLLSLINCKKKLKGDKVRSNEVEKEIYFYAILSSIFSFITVGTVSSNFRRPLTSVLIIFVYIGIISTLFSQSENVSSQTSELKIVRKKTSFLFSVLIFALCVVAVISVKDFFSDVYLKKAISYSKRGQWDNAIMFYKKSLRYKTSIEVHYYLGKTYDLLGYMRKEEPFNNKAIKEYEKVKELSPNFAKVHYHLGQVYKAKADRKYKEGEFNMATKLYYMALSEFEQELTINPYEKKLYFIVSSCYLKLENKEQAAKIYYQGLRYFPSDKTILLNVKEIEGIINSDAD